ncbi:MAG TPA: protein translocase subunit SecF [Terriglobia bacterium]|nr:protein translocase subunit SecF [Terriglobia bacterium]
MEFFHEPKFDWMGKKWYFIAASLSLAVLGIASMFWHHGLTYGLDFRGGTLVYVKFAKAPQIDAIRHELDAANLRGASVVQYDTADKHEFAIGLDLRTTSSAKALDEGKQDIVNVLDKLYGHGPEGKTDFNNAGASVIADHLITADPLGLASKGTEAATRQYQDLATAMLNYRKSPAHGGLIGSFDELKSVPGVTQSVIDALNHDFYLSSYSVFDTQIVGPKVGADLRRQALYVTLAGLGAMLIYIWFRFELIYGVAAVIATFHDVIITLGLFSLLNKEITLTVIAALLTLVGYSMNDTIVVFDRIRENVKLNRRQNFKDLINHSVNQTLSRTILTSGLTFLAVLSLYLFGGEVIHGFALVLVIGVIIGTYSSFAIASPVVLAWQNRAVAPGGVPEKPRAPSEKEKVRPARRTDREAASARR